jgi:type II secretory pathway predicted ATPase ExeA
MDPQHKWNWTRSPFQRDVDEHTFYETQAHREALARLEWIMDRKALGLLTGEIGSGKSTLIRRLLTQLDEMSYVPIYICVLNLTPKEFYVEFLTRLGEIAPYSLSKARRLWNESVSKQISLPERQWVVAIDEAQDLSEEMIQELRFVRNQQMDSCSLFPLILVGQPEIRRKVRLKKYEAIFQRIEMSYHLTGMDQQETAKYIRHHMKLTENPIPLFTDGAIQLIYSASRGIPRLINQICTHALYAIAVDETEAIDDYHIQRVLGDQEKQRG